MTRKYSPTNWETEFILGDDSWNATTLSSTKSTPDVESKSSSTHLCTSTGVGSSIEWELLTASGKISKSSVPCWKKEKKNLRIYLKFKILRTILSTCKEEGSEGIIGDA